MAERCLTEDYHLRGQEFELWLDGHGGWWLQKPGDQGWSQDDLDPKLTDKEIQSISDYVFGWYDSFNDP